MAYPTISLHARTMSASTGKCGLPISPKATALRSRMWFAARSIARLIASIAASRPSVSRKSMNSTGYGPSATNTWRAVADRTASAIASVSVEAPSHQRDEQTAESLPLNEPGASWPEWLDLKDVLAVEESRETQAAEPPEFAVRDDLRHNGSEPHPAGPRRSEEHVESRADFGIAMDPSDERIPIREPVEVRQDFPHALDRRVDLDVGPKF